MSSICVDSALKQDHWYRIAAEMLGQARIAINGTKPQDIRVKNPKFFQRVLQEGSLGLGESYMDGWWECDRLDIFFQCILASELDNQLPKRLSDVARIASARIFNYQTRKRAWIVGKEHYDLGNDLFSRMLDSYMQYSCAYWKEAETLEQAQQAKLRMICEKLQLKIGDSGNAGNTDDSNMQTPPNLEQHIKRPEAGSYIANLAAANNMFITRLRDRQAEMEYFDPLSGERNMTSMWLRNEGAHNRSHDASSQLKTQANRYVVQLGGDVLRWNSNDQDLWRLGLMAGYGNSHSTTTSNARGHNAKSKVDGYSVGIYGTWFANMAEQTGPYVDSWVQYSWFDNSVDGDGLAREEYDSKGVSASLEGGYTFKVGEDKSHSYFIQPQAQAVWMGVKADDHRETNGTQVRGEGNNNVQTRLGMRAFMKSDNGKGQSFEPFAEANWLHNTNEFGVTMNGATIEQAGAKNIAELKLGVEGNINQQLNAWGNVGQQIGDKGYSETNVMLGVKYSF